MFTKVFHAAFPAAFFSFPHDFLCNLLRCFPASFPAELGARSRQGPPRAARSSKGPFGSSKGPPEAARDRQEQPRASSVCQDLVRVAPERGAAKSSQELPGAAMGRWGPHGHQGVQQTGATRGRHGPEALVNKTAEKTQPFIKF